MDHQGRFCRRLQEVEDMEAFVGLVKDWGTHELVPQAASAGSREETYCAFGKC